MSRVKLLLGLLLTTTFLWSNGAEEAKTSELQTIIGTVRLVGNEPFVMVIITDEEGIDYIVPKDLTKEFRELMYQNIIVRARLRREEIQTADGKRIGEQLFLIDPVVVGKSND